MTVASNNEMTENKLENLVKNPDSLAGWLKLIEDLEKTNDGLSKSSSELDKDLLRSSFNSLLKKFPYLENYWIKFANWEFELGNSSNAEIIFLESLKTLPYSLKIWTEFLKFRINLGNFQYEEIKDLFKLAETKIGCHYHASEFWDIYLNFEKIYNNVGIENTCFETFLILRKVIELPLYQYSLFFSKFMEFVETKINLKNVKVFFQENDLLKFGVSDNKIKSITDNKQLSSTYLKEIQRKIKASFNSLYIANQYEVYKVFQYESKLKRQYFHTTLLPVQELDAWDGYLDYLEIQLLNPAIEFSHNNTTKRPTIQKKKIDQIAIQKNLTTRIILTYERCLISTALYEKFWIRYFWFLININKEIDAKNLLIKSCQFIPMQIITTRLLLIDYENYDNNPLTARDCVVKLLSKFPNSIEIWKYFLDTENLFIKPTPIKNILKLMSDYIQSLIEDPKVLSLENFFSFCLAYDTVSLENIVEIFNQYESTIFSTSLTYWLSLLKFLTLNRDKLFMKDEKLSTEGTLLTENDLRNYLNKAIQGVLNNKISSIVKKNQDKLKILKYYETVLAKFPNDASFELHLQSTLSTETKDLFW